MYATRWLMNCTIFVHILLASACGGGGGGGVSDVNSNIDGTSTVPSSTEQNGTRTTIEKYDAVSYDGLGYQSEFDQSYERLQGISTIEFAELYANQATPYLDKISWDATTADFWRELQSDATGYQLVESEINLFRKNGFVVSERESRPSFADQYYAIFADDLPVFITTDSILHAWHRSYDRMLMEIEEIWIAGAIKMMLQAMSESLPALWERNSTGDYREAFEDADLFLAVARSLLLGEPVAPMLGRKSRLDSIMDAIASEQTITITLFGEERLETFSQYKPRGHYTRSPQLKRYFKALIWLGRTDFNLAEDVSGDQPAYTLQQLLSGVVLHDLLVSSQMLDKLNEIDQFLQLFVGQVDSMTFSQFDHLMSENGIESLEDLKSIDQVRDFQSALQQGDWGIQHIQARPFIHQTLETRRSLPRSLSFLGQRFTLDGWIMEMTTHDYWDPRRDNSRYIPSALDTAFAVLGNSQVAPRLRQRMETTDGVLWRDGIEYQALLAAGREVIDSQSVAAWESSIYNQWLYALRALSEPTTDASYPEVMRTAAWASKTLNTQLASWTELHHDTILYVKPAAEIAFCYYPEGFVEPRIEFWQRLETLARISAQGIGTLTAVTGENHDQRLSVQQNQIAFLNRFADTIAVLRMIAQKQLSEQELTSDERWYLENVVEIVEVYNGPRQYNGWYPELFYAGNWDSGNDDALVADIHTVVPTPDGVYEGHVLNEATGAVDLLVVAIENGGDKVVYLGPVMSHFEFRTKHDERLSDEEWKVRLRDAIVPPRSEWVLEYMVPAK